MFNERSSKNIVAWRLIYPNTCAELYVTVTVYEYTIEQSVNY